MISLRQSSKWSEGDYGRSLFFRTDCELSGYQIHAILIARGHICRGDMEASTTLHLSTSYARTKLPQCTESIVGSLQTLSELRREATPNGSIENLTFGVLA